MRAKSQKAIAMAVAAALLAGACDSGNSSDSVTSAETSAIGSSSQPPSTYEGHSFDYRLVLVDWGWLFDRSDIRTVRGLLLSAENSTMVVEVTEELTPRAAALGQVEFRTGDLGLTSDEDMQGVIAERGGFVPVLVVATEAGSATHVIELADDGRRFSPGRSEFPRLGTTNLWLIRGIESGDFDYEDPDSGERLEFRPGDDQVADFVAFAIAAFEASKD